MITGFSNEHVNVNIRHLEMPKTMTDKFEISHDTVNVFKIRFNNIFKDERAMYATIAVLISIFSLLVGYTIYYIYDIYQMGSTPLNIKKEFIVDETYLAENMNNENIMLSSSLGGNQTGNSIQSPSGFSYNGQTPTPNDNSFGIVPSRKDRRIITVDDEAESSDIIVKPRQKKISFDVSEKERTNPFMPYINTPIKQKKVSYPEPLPEIVKSSDAEKIMQTTISGILYDKYSPSAILNIQNTDYLVKKGDVINNIKVLDITNSHVTVKLGANIYNAGVGEQINGKIEYNTISNLSNKFGGAVGIDRLINSTNQRL